MFESVSGIFVFMLLGGFWGREAENASLNLYKKELILAQILICPSSKFTSGLYYLDLNYSPVATGLSRFCSWLMNKTPAP